MPRSGGTYSLPTGNPISSGSVANSTTMNATLDDLGDEITNSIARDGTSAPTANVGWGNFRLTALGDASAATDAMNRQSVRISAFKASDTDRSSTTTFADDSDLVLALGAGTFSYECMLLYRLVTATTGGIKFALPFTGTRTLHRVAHFQYNGALSAFPNGSASSLESGFSVGGSSADTDYMVWLSGIITVTVAGNLKLQWAQSISNGNAARLQAGSLLVASKLA